MFYLKVNFVEKYLVIKYVHVTSLSFLADHT